MGRVAAPALVAALSFVALVVGTGIAGAQRETHMTGTNLIRPFVFGVEIPADRTACQRQENVPDGTGAVRLRTGSFGRPGPELWVTVSQRGRTIARGTLDAGWKEGETAVPLPVIRGDRLGATVCVSNRGPGMLALAGEHLPPPRAAEIGSAPTQGRARIEYLRPRAESWWSLGPELGRRIATVRAAVPGAATAYLWLALVLVVAGGALALLAREARE